MFRFDVDHVVGPEPLPNFMWFRNFGGYILRSDIDPRVVSYDPEGNEIKNFGIWGQYLYVCSYMESLELLDRVIDAKYVSNGSNSAEGAVDDFTKLAVGDAATDGSLMLKIVKAVHPRSQSKGEG